MDIYSYDLYKYRYDIYPYGLIFDRELKKYISIYTTKTGNDYPSVRLIGSDMIPRHLALHRLVAARWLKDYNESKTINHIDGNKYNFNINNLECVTSSENTTKAYEIGLIDKEILGMSRNWNRDSDDNRLSIPEVEQIIHSIMRGDSNITIVKSFNLDFRRVSDIRRKKKWKSVWDRLYPDVSPPKSQNDGTYATNIVRNDKFSLEEEIMIIEELRMNINIIIAGKHDIDPSIISRVRSRQTWRTGIEEHMKRYGIPIPLSPISNVSVKEYLHTGDINKNSEAILQLLSSMLAFVGNRTCWKTIQEINVYAVYWIYLNFRIDNVDLIKPEHYIELNKCLVFHNTK